MSDPETFATTLLTLAIDLYGLEQLVGWTPRTIRMELEQDINVKVPRGNIDKLMAGLTLLTTDDFFSNLPAFIELCNVLSGSGFDPTVFDPADSAEMAWGITEALLLRPPEDDEPFSDEIRYYMGEMVTREGITSPPDVLAIAMNDVERDDPMSNFVDDPTMYQAFFETQQSKSQEISDMLRQNLKELFDQLELLELDEGSTTDILKKLRSGI